MKRVAFAIAILTATCHFSGSTGAQTLSHPQELEMIDRVFPREVAFTRSHAR